MSLLISVFNDSLKVLRLSEKDWDVLIRQARHANLLGRLHRHLEKSGLLSRIPERPLNHLISGAAMADRQHISIRHEAGILRETFSRYGIPLILLKGAAYVIADLPSADGRVFADIDILVPHARLEEAESALIQTGWISTARDPYDQRYYRKWMHELPAMEHMFRGTALDVHHTILPPTARLKPDPALLIEASVEVPGWPGVRVLCPSDMVLHSAAHLFHEGEPDNLLRDLSDLDALLRRFDEADSEFWRHLVLRARLHHLTGPLGLALYYANRLLSTPLPPDVLDELGCGGRGGVGRRLLNVIYQRVLRPQHASAADWLSPMARRLLYIRAHWLRMPPLLLAYHLGHKLLFPPQVISVPLTDEKRH